MKMRIMAGRIPAAALLLKELGIESTPGHTTATYDLTREEHLAAARKLFDGLQESGYTAFVQARSDNPVKEFDPTAEEITFVAPMAGGG